MPDVSVNLSSETQVQPDLLLPSQLWKRVVPSSPEKRMWHVVLSDAIDQYRGKASATPSEMRNVEEWVAYRSDEVGAFDWCCSLFMLDPDAVRERIAQEREERDLLAMVSKYDLGSLKIGERRWFPGPKASQRILCAADRWRTLGGSGKFKTKTEPKDGLFGAWVWRTA